MTILAIEVISEGLLFGADRNITSEYSDGTTEQDNSSPKIFRWPHHNILLGYAGVASMNGLLIHDWLTSIEAEFSVLNSLEAMARKLHEIVQKQMDADAAGREPRPLIIHLAGFEKIGAHWLPFVWHVRNIYKLGQYGYLDVRREFLCSEEFWVNDSVKDIDHSEIQRNLKVRAKQFQPFWFHQGFDLFTFNVLHDALRAAFRLLCERHPQHDIPTTLEEWEKHLKMQILMYGAYFEAFYPKGEHYVGGGADVLSIPWPN